MILHKQIIWLFCFLNFLNLHAQDINKSNASSVSKTDKKFLKFYFEAERYKVLEDYNQAVEFYQKCIETNPEEPSPYYQIGKIQLYVFNELDDAEYNINQAIFLSPEKEWLYYDLLTIYNFQNNLELQREIYEKLIDINQDKELYYFESIRILIDLKKYQEAHRFIKKTEKQFSASPDLFLLKKEIYIKQENLKEAEKIGKKLIEISTIFYPELAETYMYFSEYNKAEETYKKLLEIEPQNAQALVALYKIYVIKNKINSQEFYLSKIAPNPEVPVETKKTIFSELLMKNDFMKYKSFKKIVKSSLSIHPEEPIFHLILGDIYGKEKLYETAIKHYHSSLYSGLIKDDYIYNKLVQMYWQQEKYNDVLKTVDEAISRFPFNTEFYYYKGLSLLNQEKYLETIETLLKGKDFIFENERLISDFYSIIGDAYHKMENHSESDQAYIKALKHNPKNTLVLNNYSYYLSIRGDDLVKAEEMIIRCIQLTEEKPNASYIDTYAWVLYQLERYDLALYQIELALTLSPSSSVLLDHYGDILYKLGRKEQARREWEKAFQLDNKNSSLEKKINQSILNE
ncbi:MAG: hypothetical protein CMD26_00465 [Flavobacteriales bacterium]|mgnify:CR=1 FL=1|nr:hypothetical protein [Flavobacteriales bacterium]|tara:strand:- start:25947 stop:27662 length:1716 start_codon:yes stop_codon:yes gene_type:complete